jgi:hypothetical protein
MQYWLASPRHHLWTVKLRKLMGIRDRVARLGHDDRVPHGWCSWQESGSVSGPLTLHVSACQAVKFVVDDGCQPFKSALIPLAPGAQ